MTGQAGRQPSGAPRAFFAALIAIVCFGAALAPAGAASDARKKKPEPAAADAELCAAGRRAGLYSATTDLRAALAQSDVVYTDTWIDMEYFLDPAFAAEKDRRLQLYMPYQLNRNLLAGLDLRIMHCLPAHRGYEIEGELLDDPRSIIMAQAQNRLHSQKAVLLKLAGILS